MIWECLLLWPASPSQPQPPVLVSLGGESEWWPYYHQLSIVQPPSPTAGLAVIFTTTTTTPPLHHQQSGMSALLHTNWENSKLISTDLNWSDFSDCQTIESGEWLCWDCEPNSVWERSHYTWVCGQCRWNGMIANCSHILQVQSSGPPSGPIVLYIVLQENTGSRQL